MNSEVKLYDDKVVNRFWSKVEKGDDNECWNWLGSCFRCGYGQFKQNVKNNGAHRFSFENHHNRKIKEGMCILHSCDNRKCVNPNHLSEGTHQQNMTDMVNKNRQAKGKKVPSSKLTKQQVDLIRIKYDIYANTTTFSLAKEFGVSNQNIWNIVNFKTWI